MVPFYSPVATAPQVMLKIYTEEQKHFYECKFTMELPCEVMQGPSSKDLLYCSMFVLEHQRIT
jgi:hypothetical protein